DRTAVLSTRPLPPLSERFQRHDVPSAGTRLGTAWSKQPKTMSGTIWPVICRAATGAGFCAFRMQFSGAETRTSDSVPSLFGRCGATMHFTAKDAYASV